MTAKLGWLIFVAGFIIAAIGSVSKPSERLKMRGNIDFTGRDIKNIAEILKRLGDENCRPVRERLPFACRWLLFGGDEEKAGGVLTSAQLKIKEKKAREVLVLGFNAIMQTDDFYQKPVFDKLDISYSPETRRFIERTLELSKNEPKIEEAKKAVEQAQKSADKTLQDLETPGAMDKEQKQAVLTTLGALENAVATMKLANEKSRERKALIVEISPVLNRLLIEDMFPGSLAEIFSLPAWYLISLGTAMGMFGLVFIYRGRHLQLAALAIKKEAKNGANFDPKGQIEQIVAMLKEINPKNSPEGVQKELENIQLHYIFPFVEHRGVLSHQMGLSGFASMFSEFSTGERYVNRAWSAIVDSQANECTSSIETAIDNFKRAIDSF